MHDRCLAKPENAVGEIVVEAIVFLAAHAQERPVAQSNFVSLKKK